MNSKPKLSSKSKDRTGKPRLSGAPADTSPRFFNQAEDFRAWLELNHATATEQVVGFHLKTSGRGGLTYAAALDEALCFGWIDGRRKRHDAESYSIRFTPRKTRSIWSNVNVRHVERLKSSGRIEAAGLAAFAARTPEKSGIYSFEQRPTKFPAALEKIFRSRKKAWAFWRAQPPGYQRKSLWWVVSAKQEETRQRRLAALIGDSSSGRRVASLD